MQILARPHNDKVGVPQVDVCIRGFKGVCCAVCIHTHGRIHSLHAGATWVPRSGRFGVLQTSVYVILQVCPVVYIHTYGHNLYMQVLDVSLAVAELVPCTRLYIHRCVHTVQLYTHLYIVNTCILTYIQVLDGCLTVTDRVSRRCL